MTSIGPTSQLISIIREQITRAQGTTLTPSPTAEKNKAKPEKKSVQSLFEMTAKRIRTIDASDPNGKRKAFKFFLESALLAEFGDDMINDPAFYQLVGQVQKTMESDVNLASQMDEAGKLLLQLHQTTSSK